MVIKSPIIILGVGRSGSKLVQNILNKNNEVYICPEMNFYSPYKKGIFSEIQNIKKDGNYSINLVKKVSKIKGKTSTFIEPMDIPLLTDKIEKGNFSPKIFFSLLVTEKANMIKPSATILGAKFPFHFSFSGKFKKWYPNTKYIYLFRDPRAVLASELIMKSKTSKSSKFPTSRMPVINRLQINIYVLVQYLAYYTHLKALLKNNKWKDSILIKFENLILDTENTIHGISNFCEIEYTDEMKDIVVYGSSFHKKQKGFNKKTLYKWEEKLTNIEKYTFKKVNSLFDKFFKRHGLDFSIFKTK